MAKSKLTTEERENLVAEYQASGKRQSQWCEEKGIKKTTLSGWV